MFVFYHIPAISFGHHRQSVRATRSHGVFPIDKDYADRFIIIEVKEALDKPTSHYWKLQGIVNI